MPQQVPMTFTFDGEQYTFEGSRLSIGEAREIKRRTGMRVWDWHLGLMALDPDAIAATVWLTLRRAGKEVEWEAIDQLDIGEFADSIAEAIKAGQEAPAEANGTPPKKPPARKRGAASKT